MYENTTMKPFVQLLYANKKVLEKVTILSFAILNRR
jgi:hypothetical protein